ncbi:heterokaryon incompatibility protein-domain-containing protein, partial [Lasiosphaeris hirsuta]
IRILVIEPAPDDDPDSEIRCRLEHVPLSSSSRYVALSYCWGPPNTIVPARIDGQRHLIRPSLSAALTELRRRRHLRVWADAVCIDQDNTEERSQQVLRMAAIYRSAAAVVAWIGAGDDG